MGDHLTDRPRPERAECPQCRGATTEIEVGQWMCLECSSRFSFDAHDRPVLARTSIPPGATREYLLNRGNALMLEKEARVSAWKGKAKAHREWLKSLQAEWSDVQAAIKRQERGNK